jgi:hypothetical protein
MKKRFPIAIAAVVLLGGVVAVLPAADPPKDAPKSTPAADDVRHIAMAYELADYGRTNKSPEMLIAAARVLRNIKPVPGSDKVTVEAPQGEKPEKFEEGKPTDLGEEANKLLNEAKELAKNDTVINELIDRLQKEKGRGSLGGPRQWSNTIRTGYTHAFDVNMVGGQVANVSVTGNGVAVFTLSATNEKGITVASSTGHNPALSWVPVETRPFTIRIHNDAGGLAAFTVYHN